MPTPTINYTTSSTLNETWKSWIGNATSTESYINESTTLKTTIWTTWQTNITSSRVIPRPRDERTPEQRARDELIARNRQRSREVRQRNAERRAEELLVAHLTPEQRAEWEAQRYFHVETADGQRRYRIAHGHVGNVRVIECTEPPAVRPMLRVGARLCAHISSRVPDEDHMLAQKLLLESEDGEDEFLRMANIS